MGYRPVLEGRTYIGGTYIKVYTDTSKFSKLILTSREVNANVT